MQVFKLIKGGYPDSVIGFDSLPEEILGGIQKGPIAGWQRAWFELLGLDHKEKAAMPFYVLDYITVNKDKQKWQEISSYVKRNVDPSVRLLDKIEAMAKPVAPDSYSEITLEPEDMTVIPLPKKETVEAPKAGKGTKTKEAVGV